MDLQAQHAAIGAEIEAAVQRVLRSGQFVLGPEGDAFEQEFAAYCGVRHGVAVRSGTSALTLALTACGVGPGDEVVTVPFTFVATVAAILDTGAAVSFVDIDPVSFTLDPTQLDAAVTRRTKAVIPVHLFGQPADMDPIREVARAHGLTVIEDAAQAHGARYRHQPVGSLGDIACFSFYPSKNLGACGEGGMVVTNDPEHDRRVRLLRSWGTIDGDHGVRRGGNHRLDEIQAATLRVKLRYLDQWNAQRRRVAATYDQLLATLAVTRPTVMPYATHVFHVYALRSRRRDALLDRLQERGLPAAVHYRVPVHLQPAYADRRYSRGQLPHAETVADEVLSLPIYPELAAETATAVAEACRDTLGIS